MELYSIYHIKCPNSTKFPREWVRSARPVHPNKQSAPHVVHFRFSRLSLMLASRVTWSLAHPPALLPHPHPHRRIHISTCNPRCNSDRQSSICRQNHLSETEAHSRALSRLHAMSDGHCYCSRIVAGVEQERGTGQVSPGFDPRRVSFALFNNYSSWFWDSSSKNLLWPMLYKIVSNTCIYITWYINCSDSRFIPTSGAKQADKSCWTTTHRESTSPGTAYVREMEVRECPRRPPKVARLVEQLESAIRIGNDSSGVFPNNCQSYSINIHGPFKN